MNHTDLKIKDIPGMFCRMRQKLIWATIDRSLIPEPLLSFFDDKSMRDLDPLELAKQIGYEIKSGCDGCSCCC